MIFSDLIRQTARLEAVHSSVMNTRYPKFDLSLFQFGVNLGKHVEAGHIDIFARFQIQQDGIRRRLRLSSQLPELFV